MTVRNWLPLIGMTASAFVFNTSEFMPIGLLSDIASDLRITEAHAGMLISIYAWVVALLSLPLMLMVCKMEFKKLLLSIIVLFIVSHVFSAMATGFWTLMLSRIGVACAHSIFWSIAAPMAVRTVPEEHKSLALGMIVTGTSVAMIVGLPLGRIIGLQIGWRMAFLCIAAVTAVVALFLAIVFPKMPNRKSFSLRKMPEILNNRVLMGIYVLTVILATSHYVAYSYIEPFLAQTAHMSDSMVTLTLIVFGGAGMIGSVMFSRYFNRCQYPFIMTVTGGVAVSLLLLQLASYSVWAMMALCVFWGAVITAYNVVFQAEIIRFAPQGGSSVAMSIFSGIFNLGIGCGALFGGMVCTWSSVAYVGYVGGILAAVATAFCVFRLIGLMKADSHS